MKKKDCLITKQNKREIIYNLINAGLAGLLVLLGSFTSGDISMDGFVVAAIASGLVMVLKFKDYWDTEKPEYSKNLLTFIK